MRKHGGTPSQRDKHVAPAAISPTGVARGRFVGGQQSGLAGCKPPPLFTRGASSCSSQGRRQGRLSTTECTHLPTYLLAGMLVFSSQSRLLGSNPIVWLCDQEPVKSFQKGPPPEKAKLKRWWTYLSQFRLTVHHIPGIKNELSDYISRNNFDALIGESSEALAKEGFQGMDVQLDLSMRTAGILEGWSPPDYQSEYKEILQTLSTGLEPRVIDGHQWYKNNQYLFYEDRIVVPEARLDGCLQWSHLSSGHTGANSLW